MEKLAHRITIVLFGIIVMFTILGIVAVIGEGNAFGNATSLFNLDTEMSLPNWFSTILLFTLSLITFFIAITETVEKRRFARHWQILGFIFLMMSMEEVAGIRDAVITDPLRNLLNLDGIFYYSWVIPIGILTVIFVVAYARFMKNLPSKTRTFFIMGILVYVIGAIGLELISGLVISNNAYSETFNYLTILEEILELIGVTLLIHSLVTYMAYESWEMVTLEKIKDSNIQIQSWFAVILGALALAIISFLIIGYVSYQNRSYVSLTTLHMWDNLPMEAPPNQDAILFGDDILPFWGASYEYQDNWDLIDVDLWWWTQSAPEDNYSIGVYLLNSEGVTVAQTDGAISDLYYGTIETSQMEANRIYVDQRIIKLPEDLPAGDYALYLAVYQWWDGVKLTLENGDDLLLIGDIVIP